MFVSVVADDDEEQGAVQQRRLDERAEKALTYDLCFRKEAQGAEWHQPRIPN